LGNHPAQIKSKTYFTLHYYSTFKRLRMNQTISGAPLTDEDRERLNIIRKTIAAGTYHIDAKDVAAKLILSMLEFDDDPSSLSAWVKDDAESLK
jgi:Anti-sigma-28 factor, FlgM